MARYIGLLKFTEKGLQTIKDTTKRATAAREAAKKFGVTMHEMHWTLGPYDAVVMLEAEDEYAVTAFSLATAQQGNVSTLSMRAYTAAEVEKVIAKMP